MDIQAAFKLNASVTGQQAIDKLNQSVGALPGLAKAAGMAFAGLGAGLSVSVFKSKFDEMVQSMLGLKDAAEKTGSTIEKMGALRQAAKITGDEFSNIEAGVIRLTKALAGQDDEAKGAAHALAAIGLSIKDLRAMDPADAFSTIAKRMAEFENGAGKTAIAMDIFGKRGAELLPFMNDYVEIGDQVSTVTQKQAEMAEDYDRSLRKLQAAKQEMYKVVAVEVLPVANDFVQMLIDTTTQTKGLKDEAKSLAKDGSMRDFFRESARFASAFLDVAAMIPKVFAQIKDSVAVVLDDITTAIKIIGIGVGAGFTKEGRDAISAAIDERNARVAAANERMSDRWSNTTPFTDALEKRFRQTDLGDVRDARDRMLDGASGKKSIKVYQSRAPSPLKVERDELATFIKHYEEATEKIKAQTAALGQSNEEREITLALAELEYKGVKKGTEDYERLSKARIDALRELNSAQRSWATGMKQGFNEYIDSATNWAAQTKNLVVSAFKGMEDALVQFAMTGKLEFKQLANSIIADMIRIAIQQSITGPLAKMVFSSFGGASGAYGPTPTGGNIAQANGGAWSGGVQMFASGAAFGPNRVLSAATPFAYGGGFGVAGEAGPEAIMPLRRGQDGKLGVAANGSGSTVVNVTVNADGGTAGDGTGKMAQLGNAIASAVRTELIKQKRPGGLLAA